MKQKIHPNKMCSKTKIPDAIPGIISLYALNEEQRLLASLMYNRLIDLFTRMPCYPLQSHCRIFIPHHGQVETDEIYIGINQKGTHYIFPIQIIKRNGEINLLRIQQNIALCAYKFPSLICCPIGVQFVDDKTIALYEFQEKGEKDKGIVMLSEKHYYLDTWEAILESHDIRKKK